MSWRRSRKEKRSTAQSNGFLWVQLMRKARVRAKGKVAVRDDSRVLGWSVLVSVMFLGGLILAGWLNHMPMAFSWWYLGCSAVLFLVYARDKSAARNGAWRTSEGKLHFLALLGGWPGALLAQQFLRHKSCKQSFRAVFWATVFLNLGLLAVWLSPYSAGVREGMLSFLSSRLI